MTRQARLGGRATIACVDIDVPDEVKPLAGHEPGGRRARRGGADDAGRQPILCRRLAGPAVPIRPVIQTLPPAPNKTLNALLLNDGFDLI